MDDDLLKKVLGLASSAGNAIKQGIANLTGNVKAIADNKTRNDYFKGLATSANHIGGFSRPTVTQAIRATSDNVARDFGNIMRNNEFTKSIPASKPIYNMVGNTAESVGSGVSGVAKNIMSVADNPTWGNFFKQGASSVYNVAKIPAVATPVFQFANAATQVPQNNGKTSLIPRLAAGVIRGQTGIDSLSPEVAPRKTLKIGSFEIDPAESVGKMIGFVKNPVNNALFKGTEKFKVAPFGNKVLNFLATNGLRGAVEDVAMSIKDLPDNATTEQKIAFLRDNALWGATAEVGVRGAGEIAQSGLKGVGNAVKNMSATELLNMFDELKSYIPKVELTNNPKAVAKVPTTIDPLRDMRGRFSMFTDTAQPKKPTVDWVPDPAQPNRMLRTENGVIAPKQDVVPTSELPNFMQDPMQPNRFMRVEKAKSRLNGNENMQTAAGGMFGLTPETDENGMPTGKLSYDWDKGVLGMAAMTAGNRKRFIKSGDSVPSKPLRETVGEAVDSVKSYLKGNLDEVVALDEQARKQGLPIPPLGLTEQTKAIKEKLLRGELLNETEKQLSMDEHMNLVTGMATPMQAGKIGQKTNDIVGGFKRIFNQTEKQIVPVVSEIQPQKPSFVSTFFGSKKLDTQRPPMLSPQSQIEKIIPEIPQPTDRRVGQQILGVEATSDNIIQQAKSEIGTLADEPKKSLKEIGSELYTQWVNRYAPIEKLADQAKSKLKEAGAVLRPEYDPTYLVRRLTGAGGIADQRYQTELKPILNEVDKLKIDKGDLDVYLKARRDIGLAERGIVGSDKALAEQRITAIEQKYPQVSQVAQQLYDYQNKGFQEMVDAGFLSPESAQLIRSSNPDYVPFQRVMDEMDEYLGLPTRKTMQGSQPIQKIEGSNKQVYSPIESIIGNTLKQRAAIEKNAVAKSIVGLQDIADLGIKQVEKSGSDTITVWNNGVKEFYQVGQDVAEVAKGLNEETANTLLKIFQAPAQLLRQGATGRNPDFIVPNIVRDQLDAGISSKYGYIPFVDYTSGFKSLLAKDANTISNRLGFKFRFNEDVYNRWANSGAKIDLGELSGRKSIEQSFDKKTTKKNLFDWMVAGLDLMGRYSEQPTRIGLFKKAYNKTGNEMLSMLESRDATVDFARMGSKMKVANSIIPFLNVGVQGFDKLIRAVKDNPAKVALNMSIYGALPAATLAAYNILGFPEEYAEIPQYEKDANFIIVTGRNDKGTVDYITFPKGNILPLVTNPIESLISYANGQDQQSFGEFATQFISSALPVIGDGSSPKEVAIKTIGSNLPQLIKPVTENLLNKSFWKYNAKTEESKEIVPYYMKDKEPYKQSYEWTPATYKAIGAVLNVSPLQVQNLMEGYLAGYTKVPVNIIDSLIKVSNGEGIDKNQIPILRRFAKQTTPTSAPKAQPSSEKEGSSLMERITGKVSASSDTYQLPSETEDLSVLYKDAQSTINSYRSNKVKSEAGLVDKSIEDYQAELDSATKLKKQIESQFPDKVIDINIETYKSGGGQTTQERAEWAASAINNVKDETELDTLLEKLYDGDVLTKSVVDELRTEHDISLNSYTSGGKKKSVGGTGKSKTQKAEEKALEKYQNAVQKEIRSERDSATNDTIKGLLSTPKLSGIAELEKAQASRPKYASMETPDSSTYNFAPQSDIKVDKPQSFIDSFFSKQQQPVLNVDKARALVKSMSNPAGSYQKLQWSTPRR